jgi:hypothetical protein
MVFQSLYVPTALRNYLLVSCNLKSHLEADVRQPCPYLDVKLA